MKRPFFRPLAAGVCLAGLVSTSGLTAQETAAVPAANIAKTLINPKANAKIVEAAVKAHAGRAGEIIAEITRDLPNDSKIEYARIPVIWHLAIECTRKGDAGQIRKLFEVSLPKGDAPMRDWQAVVTGGGIVNGISQAGKWPAERSAEILGDDADLKKRWERALELAVPMTNDEKVKQGTRYDALRLLGVTPWEKNGALLVKYLSAETPEELQMGAVSALVDVNSPEAAKALVTAWPGLKPGNRKLAAEGLTRTPARARAFITEVEAGRIKESDVDAATLKKLQEQTKKAAAEK
jgi:hypothetical protein